jgi:hypothetical protein
LKVQQIPQVPAVQNQAGNQPRPDGNQNISNQNNNNSPPTPSLSNTSSSSSPNSSNSAGNNNTPSSSTTTEQQNNVNDNNMNDANDIAVPQQENRSITLQDIEHALWTFVASLIPTNAPDVAQDEVGM